MFILYMFCNILKKVDIGIMKLIMIDFFNPYHANIFFVEKKSSANCVCCIYSYALQTTFIMETNNMMGVQWLSGRVLDSRPRGCGFEPHRCHCIVVLEQDTFFLA